jgi:hypothetical protein
MLPVHKSYGISSWARRQVHEKVRAVVEHFHGAIFVKANNRSQDAVVADLPNGHETTCRECEIANRPIWWRSEEAPRLSLISDEPNLVAACKNDEESSRSNEIRTTSISPDARRDRPLRFANLANLSRSCSMAQNRSTLKVWALLEPVDPTVAICLQL